VFSFFEILSLNLHFRAFLASWSQPFYFKYCSYSGDKWDRTHKISVASPQFDYKALYQVVPFQGTWCTYHYVSELSDRGCSGETDNRDGRFYFTANDGRATFAATTMIDNEATVTFDLQARATEQRWWMCFEWRTTTWQSADKICMSNLYTEPYRSDVSCYTQSSCRCRCLNSY